MKINISEKISFNDIDLKEWLLIGKHQMFKQSNLKRYNSIS